MSAEPTQDNVVSIKGFDANWQCRGYQFEIGKTYLHDGPVEACNSGFHACPVEHHPLSVFEFYPPAGSRFAIVEQGGATDAENAKLASASLTISAEITIPDIVKRAWDYVWSRCTIEGPVATGTQGAASATGTRGAASSSNGSAAMTNGHGGKVRGDTADCPLYAADREPKYPYALISIACGITGRDGIKVGVWYAAKDGKLVEVQS